MQTVTGLELNLFERAGYFIRRGLLEPDLVRECLAAAGRVVEGCQAGVRTDSRSSGEARADSWGANNLFRPETREPALVNVLAHEGLTAVIEDLLGPEAACCLASLLASPAGASTHLPWHRDLMHDLDAPRERQTVELARWQNHVQLNLALLPDDAFWVVPGTHLEPLLPEQLEAVERDPLGDVPGQVCVRLEPGDVVFYNANLLHRGWVRSGNPRQTLHYAFIGPGYPHESIAPQAWLEDRSLLESLLPRARAIIERSPVSSRAPAERN